MNIGHTFVNLNVGSPTHLWFVVTAPDVGESVVILNLTTLREHSDTACILRVGDHPFIGHDSVIEYRRGQIVSILTLRNLRDSNTIALKDPATSGVVDRIRTGASSSLHTPGKVRVAIEACQWRKA